MTVEAFMTNIGGKDIQILPYKDFDTCFAEYERQKKRAGHNPVKRFFQALYNTHGRWAFMDTTRSGPRINVCFSEDVAYAELAGVIAHEVDHCFKMFFTQEEAEASAKFTGGVTTYACSVADKLLE